MIIKQFYMYLITALSLIYVSKIFLPSSVLIFSLSCYLEKLLLTILFINYGFQCTKYEAAMKGISNSNRRGLSTFKTFSVLPLENTICIIALFFEFLLSNMIPECHSQRQLLNYSL